MKTLMRRVRGAIGMGLAWGFVSGLIGGIPRWILGVNADAPFGIIFGVFGFAAGVTFAALVALTQGRRRLDELSTGKLAGLGALGGTLLSAAFAFGIGLAASDAILVIPTFAAACAACATGTLALARRSAARELPASNDTHALDDADDGKLLLSDD